MLGNLYATEFGVNYMKKATPARKVIKFCIFCLKSMRDNIVGTAAKIIYNHLIKVKDDLEEVGDVLVEVCLEVIERFPKIMEHETIKTLL